MRCTENVTISQRSVQLTRAVQIMSDMEYHYQTIGRILAHLINRGLAKIDLKPADAMNIMTERRGDEKQVLSTFADCVEWMRDEGLIRVESVFKSLSHGRSFMGVQLTSAGIALIKRDPKDDEIGDSIEKRVKDGEGDDLGASVYTKIGEFVGGAIGGIVKSLGGG